MAEGDNNKKCPHQAIKEHNVFDEGCAYEPSSFHFFFL